MSNIIDKIQLSGVTYDIGGQGGSGVSVVEVTQAEYDALPSSAKTDTSKMYVITDAEAGDLTNYYTKTETNTLLGGKADTATTYTKDEVDNAITAATSTKQDTLVSSENIKTINNESILGSGNIDIQGGGGGGTVETAITSSSTNAVESKAIWSATTYNKEVTLQWSGNYSTNYPQGCTKIKVEDITNYSSNNIYFNDDSGTLWSNITISNMGSISVDTSNFQDASYEIDGSTVIISYPTVTTVTKLNVGENGKYTYKAVVEGAWIADNTYMKEEVDAVQNTLQSNINQKLDATAYTPVNVDSIITQGSTNPVQGNTLYNELRVASGGTSDVVLSFDGNGNSTNYPTNCRQLRATLDTSLQGSLTFKDSYGVSVGTYTILKNNDWYDITNNLNGSTYEVSNNILTISYPSIGNISTIVYSVSYGSLTPITAVGSALYIPLKDQVVANTTALGGLSLVKLTQAQYDALATKDNSTLYVIVN